jgi:hypothetical protein
VAPCFSGVLMAGRLARCDKSAASAILGVS